MHYQSSCPADSYKTPIAPRPKCTADQYNFHISNHPNSATADDYEYFLQPSSFLGPATMFVCFLSSKPYVYSTEKCWFGAIQAYCFYLLIAFWLVVLILVILVLNLDYPFEDYSLYFWCANFHHIDSFEYLARLLSFGPRRSRGWSCPSWKSAVDSCHYAQLRNAHFPSRASDFSAAEISQHFGFTSIISERPFILTVAMPPLSSCYHLFSNYLLLPRAWIGHFCLRLQCL